MNLPIFLKSKIFWIVSLVVVLLVVGLAVGLTYTSSSSSSSSSSPAAEGSLLVKTRSEIQVLELKDDASSKLVVEPVYGIVAFDAYPGRTVYYTTTKPGEGILSSAREKYPDISQYAKDWTKSAIAVDYVNDKLYVLDSVEQSVYVIDTEGKYYKTLSSGLDSPIDLLLDPYERFLFVLQASSIVKLSMDGSSIVELVKKSNLRAFAIERSSKTLYYSSSESIESFNYVSNVRTTVMPWKAEDIPSLAVTANYLFFLQVSRASSKPLPLRTILSSCRLRSGICGELTAKYNDDTMQSIKNWEKKVDPKQNPCAKDNGGCQQLCILLSSEKVACLCNEARNPKDDKRTCTASA